MSAQPQTTLDVLVKARELISVPERWTLAVDYACDEAGKPVHHSSPSAVRWTPAGAILRCSDANIRHRALYAWTRAVLGSHVSRFGATHADILAILDSAIAAERAKPESEGV